jgi:hypothetical protein
MALNPWQFVLYAAALVCCWLGRRVALRSDGDAFFGILFAGLAMPAVVYNLYYLHLWEEPIWLYRVRSWTGSELFAAPAGLLAGWVQGRMKGRWRISIYSMSALLLLALAVPYIKQMSGPMEMRDKWKDGVCLQSSPSTCGPASAATLLAALGIRASEAELARDAFSTMSGTENWYLKRAIEKRGVSCHYEWAKPPVKALPCPAIAGLNLGPGMGHFVAVLEECEDGYLVADPIAGKTKVLRDQLEKGIGAFSGFFLVLSEPK